jgi:aldehyde:ferredoxin oxidoreductase
MLPSRNFQSGSMDGLEDLHGEALHATHRTDKNACAACTIGCEHHYALKTKSKAGNGASTVRLEYESLYALGPMCGINDPDVVLQAARLCDDLTLDSITTGATIAWAMECRDQGINLGVPAESLPSFGDGESLLRTIELIARREGIGDLLADGSREAARQTGQGSDAWTLHVKGLELPGYDPRKLPTLALGLAVATRGACHNRSSAYEVDLSDQLDRNAEIEARVDAAIRAEDQATILDSINLCKFLRHCFDDLPSEAARLLTYVTGIETSREDLLRTGQRVNTLKKLFNIKHGWSRDDDWLPPRILESSDAGSLLSPIWLSEARETYYQRRGWDPAGIPTQQTLDDLQLPQLRSTLPHVK